MSIKADFSFCCQYCNDLQLVYVKKKQHFQACPSPPPPLPAILGGGLCYSESFHPVPKKIAEFTLSAVQELPEVGGKGGPGWGGQVQTNAVGRSIMKHTNTQLCVDSLPLFSPSRHNRPLIPLRSAHGGQTVPVQQRQPHLVEPNSGIIWDYGRRRIEQRACWIPHCTDVTRLRLRKAELL